MQIDLITLVGSLIATNTGNTALTWLLSNKRRKLDADELQQKIINAQLATLETLLKGYEISNAKLKEEYLKALEEGRKFEDLAEQLDKQMEDMQTETLKLRTHNKEMEETINKMQSKIIQLKEEVQKLTDENNQYAQEIKTLRSINTH